MLKKYCTYFCFILSLFCSGQLYSQAQFQGVLRDTVMNVPVPRAHIHNVSKNYISLADREGNFSIVAEISDTILVSSIGYYWYFHVVEDFDFCTLNISPQVYLIDKVFKYAAIPFHELTEIILAMPFARDSIRLGLQFEKYYPMRDYQPGHLAFAMDGLITAVYNSVNRHARNRVRALELIENAHSIVIINQKFSKPLVQELTNLPDEYLDTFISFLNLSDEFLYESSQYVIIAYMYAKFEEFLLLNPHLQRL